MTVETRSPMVDTSKSMAVPSSGESAQNAASILEQAKRKAELAKQKALAVKKEQERILKEAEEAEKLAQKEAEEAERIVRAEALAKAELERRAKEKAEIERIIKEREETTRWAKAEAARRLQELKDKKARYEAQKKAEAEKLAKEEAEKKAKAEAEAKAKAEAEEARAQKQREEEEAKAAEYARKIRELRIKRVANRTKSGVVDPATVKDFDTPSGSFESSGSSIKSGEFLGLHELLMDLDAEDDAGTSMAIINPPSSKPRQDVTSPFGSVTEAVREVTLCSMAFQSMTATAAPRKRSRPGVVIEELIEDDPSTPRSSAPPNQKRSRTSKGKDLENPGTTFAGVWFHSAERIADWPIRSARMIIEEKTLNPSTFPVQSIIQKIEQSGLLSTITKVSKFRPQIVREFIGNLSAAFGQEGNEEYGVVYIRGHRIIITPSLINEFFDIDDANVEDVEEGDLNIRVSTLLGATVENWNDRVIVSKNLTTSFAILHTISVRNWLPTSVENTVGKSEAFLLFDLARGRRINIGRLIFNQIASHSQTSDQRHPICFPSLIHQLILNQAPNIVQTSDVFSGKTMVFSVNHQLYGDPHKFDLPASEAHLQKKGTPRSQLSTQLSHQPSKPPKDDSAPTKFTNAELLDFFTGVFQQTSSAIEHLKSQIRELRPQRDRALQMINTLREDANSDVDSDSSTA